MKSCLTWYLEMVFFLLFDRIFHIVVHCPPHSFVRVFVSLRRDNQCPLLLILPPASLEWKLANYFNGYQTDMSLDMTTVIEVDLGNIEI